MPNIFQKNELRGVILPTTSHVNCLQHSSPYNVQPWRDLSRSDEDNLVTEAQDNWHPIESQQQARRFAGLPERIILLGYWSDLDWLSLHPR